MTQTLAVQKTKAKYIVQGTPWYRICHDCGYKQSEDRHVNERCEHCNSEAVVWIPWPERRE